MKTRIIFIVLTMSLIGVQAFAGPSYTSSMSFSQGFDLETGVVDQGIQKLLDEGTGSPDVIRLVFVVQDIEPQQVMYSFDPEIDFQIGYDAENEFFGLLPFELSAVAILDKLTFDTVTTLDLNTLDFSYDPAEIRFDPDYTLIVYTADENFYKLGNFALVDSGVSFDWEKIEDVSAAVPEPSTMLLLGTGCFAIGVMIWRKRKASSLFLLLMVFTAAMIASPVESFAWSGNTADIAAYAETHYTNGGTCPTTDANVSCAGFVKKVLLEVTGIAPGSGWVPEGWRGQPGYPAPLQTIYGAQQVSWSNVKRGDIITNTYSGTGHIAIVSEKTANSFLITDCTTYFTGNYKVHIKHDGTWMRNGTEKFWRIKGVKVDPIVGPFPLGGVDLDAYCRQKGYDGVSLGSANDPYSWSCKNSHTTWISANPTWSGISVNQACQEQYPRYANVFAKAGNWNDAYSWTCYAKRSYTLKIWRFRKTITYNQRLGGVNIRAFCERDRARGQRGVNEQRLSVRTRYQDVSRNSNDAGSWRCQGKQEYRQSTSQVGISVTDACRIQKKNPAAYARVTNRNSAFSWQCYIYKTVYESTFQSLTTSTSKTEFWVSVNKAGTGSGTVSAGDVNCGSDCAGGAYKVGSFVDLKAIPSADSDFAGWLVNGQPASGAIPVSSDPVLTAKFDKKPETYPVVTRVSPNPVPRKADWSRQWFIVYGRNFQPGAKLLFKIVDTSYVYPDRIPNYISSTELRYYISVGPNIYDWTVEVINPDGRGSNAYGFQVR